MPDLSLEQTARAPVVGVDEVGRGPWAGPVVAGAVILDPASLPQRIDDSKRLKPALRAELAALLQKHAKVGLGVASVAEIDRLNILEATLLAMGRAVDALGIRPSLALVDGHSAPRLSCPVRTVVAGDRRSLSIAAASIVAKVFRDGLMSELARDHPGFGWERNFGYGTPEHRAAIERLGITAHHRRSFAPIRAYLSRS